MKPFDLFRKRRLERIIIRDVKDGDVLLFHVDHTRIPQLAMGRLLAWLKQVLPPGVKVVIVPPDTAVDILRKAD